MNVRWILKKANIYIGPLASIVVSLIAPFFIKKNVGNIVIALKLVGLGDAVLMIPVLKQLKLDYPDNKIVVIASPITKAIFVNEPFIDEVVCYDLLGRNAGIFEFVKFVNKVRSLSASYYIDFEQHYLLTPLIGVFSGAVKRIGLVHALNFRRGNNFNCSVDYDDNKYMIFNYFRLYEKYCCELGINPCDFNIILQHRLTLPVVDIVYPFEYDKRRTKIVGLHPGSGANGDFRRWPIENFVLLTKTLLSVDGIKVMLFHGPGEEYFRYSFDQFGNNPNFYIPNCERFVDFTGHLTKLDCFVVCDTGPYHLSSWLGTPTIGLFGPNTPMRYGSPLEHVVSLYVKQQCSPCINIHLGIVPKKCEHFERSKCMDSISVDMVKTNIFRLLRM